MAEKLKSFYFKHDENAANDIKLMMLRSQLAMEGYGIYWFLLEQLSMAGGKMPMKMIPMLATTMQTTPDKVHSVVKNYDLFMLDEDGFFSERLNRELERRGTLSEAGRKAGLKSAEIRKIKALQSTTVERPLNGSATTVQPEEKRREEKSIEDNSLQKRKQKFIESISDFKSRYEAKTLNEFFAYWTETNDSKTVMRFEKEKFFELSKRLATWFRNEKQRTKFMVPTTPSSATSPSPFNNLERFKQEPK